jgi:hypothetical protein
MLGFYPISADAISGEGITLQTVSIVGSGGFVIGGASPVIQSINMVGSGGFVAGGSALLAKGATINGASGFVIGGSSPSTQSVNMAGVGGFVIGGSGGLPVNVFVIGSGGFVIGGSAILSPPPIPEMVLACSIGSSNIIAFIQYPSVNVSVKVASIQAVVTSSDMECDVEDGAIILQLAA